MIHSVWDWNKVHYNYYKSRLPASVGGWRPLTGLGISGPSRVKRGNTLGEQVGADIEQVLPFLPADAKYVGSGPQAIGQVCRKRPNRRALSDDAAPPVPPNDTLLPDEIKTLRDKLKSETRYYRAQTLSAFLLGLSLGSYTAKFRTVTTVGFAVSALLLGLAAVPQHPPVKLTKDA